MARSATHRGRLTQPSASNVLTRGLLAKILPNSFHFIPGRIRSDSGPSQLTGSAIERPHVLP